MNDGTVNPFWVIAGLLTILIFVVAETPERRPAIAKRLLSLGAVLLVCWNFWAIIASAVITIANIFWGNAPDSATIGGIVVIVVILFIIAVGALAVRRVVLFVREKGVGAVVFWVAWIAMIALFLASVILQEVHATVLMYMVVYLIIVACSTLIVWVFWWAARCVGGERPQHTGAEIS